MRAPLRSAEDPYKLGLPSIHDPGRHWDPVFAAAQDAEMPLCTHIGSASWTPPGPPEQPFTVGLANTTTVSTLTCYEWLLSDVFVRFPRLRLVLSEGGIGWLPHAVGARRLRLAPPRPLDGNEAA